MVGKTTQTKINSSEIDFEGIKFKTKNHDNQGFLTPIDNLILPIGMNMVGKVGKCDFRGYTQI